MERRSREPRDLAISGPDLMPRLDVHRSFDFLLLAQNEGLIPPPMIEAARVQPGRKIFPIRACSFVGSTTCITVK